MDLDSVLDDLDSEDGNSTTEISNPEEARAETQKVVNLLEQLLLSDAGDEDDGGGAGDGDGNRGTNGSSGVDQGQQQADAGQSQSDKGIPVTAAPTKPPMSQKEIQRAKVTEVSFRSSGLINGSIVSR